MIKAGDMKKQTISEADGKFYTGLGSAFFHISQTIIT